MSDDADRLDGLVGDARSALARSVQRANLSGDPLAPVLEAVAESLGAQLALHRASTVHLDTVRRALDTATEEAVARGKLELEANREGIINQLAPQLARLTESQVRVQRTRLTVKAILLTGLAALGTGLAIGVAAYVIGYNGGLTRGLYDRSAVDGAVAAAGPAAETAFVTLLRSNNLPKVLEDCSKASVRQGNRRACVAPLWLDPPEPPQAAPANGKPG